MERAMELAAGGRVAWGALALAAPGLNVKLAGMSGRDAPELRYLIRGDVPRASAAGLAAITGAYTALDILALQADRPTPRATGR